MKNYLKFPVIMHRALLNASVISAAVLLSAEAQAWDGVVSTPIGQIHTTDGVNLAFRVYGTQPMCGTGTEYWAYMNVSYNNYQATAALLMSSWLTSRSVTIFSNRDTNGYCQIGYVQFG